VSKRGREIRSTATIFGDRISSRLRICKKRKLLLSFFTYAETRVIMPKYDYVGFEYAISKSRREAMSRNNLFMNSSVSENEIIKFSFELQLYSIELPCKNQRKSKNLLRIFPVSTGTDSS